MSQTLRIFLFITCVILMITAQVLWKVTSIQIHLGDGIIKMLYKTLINPIFIFGSILYVLATVIWIYLLSQYDYSKIYPIFVGACMILSLMIGAVFFNEVSGFIYKLLGICLITTGIILIVQS